MKRNHLKLNRNILMDCVVRSRRHKARFIATAKAAIFPDYRQKQKGSSTHIGFEECPLRIIKGDLTMVISNRIRKIEIQNYCFTNLLLHRKLQCEKRKIIKDFVGEHLIAKLKANSYHKKKA